MTPALFGTLIAYIGGFAVQWLRGKKKIPEVVTVVIQAAVASTAAYVGHGAPVPDVGSAAMVALGTQSASSLANVGVAVVPRTNSQP